MTMTDAARERLERLLNASRRDAHGLRIEDILGTCRGSTLRLRPCSGPEDGDRTVTCDGLELYVPERFGGILETAVLDYERAFLSRGLRLRWQHGTGCMCHGDRG